jgi:hypothetical protein
MDQREKQIRQRLKDDFTHYANKCLKIRTKSGSIEPLELNKAQEYIHSRLQEQKERTGKVRALILKGRQQGCSTYVGARFYHHVTYNFGCQAFIMAHEKDATNNLYEMAKRYYEYTPDLVKPQLSKSNAKELVFGKLSSGYKLGTAENKKVGRSATIQLLHGSEVAFWNNSDEHAKGLLQAVPNAINSEIILESTANGVGNYFHTEWQKAESGVSDFIAIFVPWFWQSEYTETVESNFKRTPEEEDLAQFYDLSDEQLTFRRKKIIQLSVNGADGAKAFCQEYPMCAAEAFVLTGEDNYIDASIVQLARKTELPTHYQRSYGPMVLGVDPARFGDDRTAIIRRRGRIAYKLESHIKQDTMQVAGIVYQIIINENPAKVCIDSGGLGAGVIDRLRELAPNPEIIVPVNFGGKPLNSLKYKNKKAEMWGEMREWLAQDDEPVQIPDSDELQSDLCNTKYRVDSSNRLEMESKEHQKRRGIRSSDMADALALTFAVPTHSLTASIKNNQASILDGLVSSFEQTRGAIERSRR